MTEYMNYLTEQITYWENRVWTTKDSVDLKFSRIRLNNLVEALADEKVQLRKALAAAV